MSINSIQDLEKSIISAAQHYYDGTSPKSGGVVSDEEFDMMVDNLKELNPDNQLLSTVGWGSTVNNSNSHRSKKPHLFTVGSLEKVQSTSDIEFKPDDIYTHKLDGISLVAYYMDGKLQHVLTRGDGFEGLDITSNIEHAVSSEIESGEGLFWVRGEAVIDLEAFKSSMSHKYANPRNAVAGLMNSTDRNEFTHNVEFIVYSCSIEGGKDKQINRANELGFSVSPFYDNMDIESLLKEYGSSRFLVDGMVCSSVDNEYAIKFPSKVKDVVVTEVVWEKSKLGTVIPVLSFDPVWMGNSTVSRCSGFNYSQIFENKVGVGTTIQLKMANEVIPNWVSTSVSEGDKFEYPEEFKGITKIEGVHMVMLTRGDISIDSMVSLMYDYSPLGVGVSLLSKLCKDLDLTTPSKLVCYLDTNPRLQGLDEYVSEAYLERVADMFNRFQEGVEMGDLIYNSFTKGVGSTASHIIQSWCEENSLDGLIESMDSGVIPESLKLNSPARVGLLREWEYIKTWLVAGFKFTEPEVVEGFTVNVCFTGKLSKPRKDLASELGVMETSLSKASYLITDNPESGSSKNKKAKSLGVSIISETEFRSKYGKGG